MRLFTNNARGTLSEPFNGSISRLVLQPGEGAQFASPTGLDYQEVTLVSGPGVLILKVLSRSADTLFIEPIEILESFFPVGSTVSARLTAEAANAFSEQKYSQVVNSALSALDLGLEHENATLRVSSATPATVTILGAASSQFHVGSYVDVVQSGAGKVTIAPESPQATGDSWQLAESPGGTSACNGMNHLNGIFIAAKGGTIITSANGIDWTGVAVPGAGTWFAFTYADGKFVGVAFDGHAAVSADGVTWARHQVSASGLYLFSIAYGAGVFVACGDEGFLATSPDGITWTPRTTSYGGSTWFNKIIFANGLFVAVGSNGLITSPDGVTWTLRSTPGAGEFIGVVYQNLLFIAFGASGGCFTSADGITWTSRVSQFGSDAINDIAFAAGLYVAVGGAFGASSKASTSPDGVTWTLRTLDFTATQADLVRYVGGRFIVTGGRISGTTPVGLCYSEDGITWTASDSALTFSRPLNMAIAGDLAVIGAMGGKISVSSPLTGVTINTPETLSTRKQFSRVRLNKVGTYEWDLTGDVELSV